MNQNQDLKKEIENIKNKIFILETERLEQSKLYLRALKRKNYQIEKKNNEIKYLNSRIIYLGQVIQLFARV